MLNPSLVPKNYYLKKQLQDWDLKSKAVLIKANKIIDNIPDFTFRIFELKFNKRGTQRDDVYLQYMEKIESLNKEGKINTAASYQCSLKSSSKFFSYP